MHAVQRLYTTTTPGQIYKLFIEIKMNNSTAMVSATSMMIKQILLNIYKKGKKPSYTL